MCPHFLQMAISPRKKKTFPDSIKKIKKWFFTVFLGDLEGAPPPRTLATFQSLAPLGLRISKQQWPIEELRHVGLIKDLNPIVNPFLQVKFQHS